MKPTVALLVLMLTGYLSSSQSYAWSVAYGNAGSDNSPRLAIDLDGHIYAAGAFLGTLDFDPGPGVTSLTSGTSGFASDGYVSRFDTAGHFQWVRHLAPGFNHILLVSDIVFDPDGFLYVTGHFDGTADFDPGPNTHNLTTPGSSFDAFLVKLDIEGNFIWAINIGAAGQEYGKSIALDPDGNILLTGIFTGTADFDPGPDQALFTVDDMVDVFIAKYTSEGDFLWADQVAGTLQIGVDEIVSDKAGNVLLCGAFDGRRDFNPGTDSAFLSCGGLWDAFVLKLDTDGNFLWVRNLGNDNDNWAHAMAIDQFNNVLVTGYFSGTVDFDSGPEIFERTALNSDIYVWKLDAAGGFSWVDQLGGISYEQGRAMCLDEFENIYVTGFYAETVDFDPGPGIVELTCTGDNDLDDVFAFKLRQDGTFGWARTLGGRMDDGGRDILPGRFNDLYITGIFQGRAGFSPGLAVTDSFNSAGQADVFLARWIRCKETYSVISPTSCGPYISPSGHFTWSDSGNYTDTIKNLAGCDSVITIQLTVVTINTLVGQIPEMDMLKALEENAIYQWIDCQNGFAPIAGEIHQEFLPQSSGTYAVIIFKDGCSDTSACIEVLINSLDHTGRESGLNIFPNPNQGTFYLSSASDNPLSVLNVLSLEGEVLVSEKIVLQKTTAVVLDLLPGAYLMDVRTDRTRYLKKLIIQ